MERKMCFALQFFAEEGQGETAGGNAADAGQQEESREGQGGQRMSWEEIMADPEYRSEYDRQVQSIVKKRLRDRQGNEERLKRLDAAMDEISKSFGMERSQGQETDPATLVETIRRERVARSNEAARRAAQAREQLERLRQQEEVLRQSVPDFDLARELENPTFLRLTAPHTGLRLEEAYYAAHHRELGERLARASLVTAAQAVSAGRARPRELRGGQSASCGSSAPRQMTREQREELKKRIYQAKAQGKKLPYGS